MTKQELLKMVEELPDEITEESLEDFATKLEKARFMESVNRGLREADNNEGTPHDEFVERFKRRFQA